jgi:hypothetical protein
MASSASSAFSFSSGGACKRDGLLGALFIPGESKASHPNSPFRPSAFSVFYSSLGFLKELIGLMGG